MHHVRLAGDALLVFVALRSKTIGLLEGCEVLGGTQFAEPRFELAVDLVDVNGRRGFDNLGRI